MAEPLRQGDWVDTPKGLGRIVFVRMEWPDYATPAAMSVRLESKKNEHRYAGTMFNAADVERAVTCAVCEQPVGLDDDEAECRRCR